MSSFHPNDKAIKQWHACLRACVKAKVATLSTNFKDQFRMFMSMNVSHIVEICHVLTISNQLICKGVANFGTRCMNQSYNEFQTDKVLPLKILGVAYEHAT